jgi:hypothetical protein
MNVTLETTTEKDKEKSVLRQIFDKNPLSSETRSLYSFQIFRNFRADAESLSLSYIQN